VVVEGDDLSNDRDGGSNPLSHEGGEPLYHGPVYLWLSRSSYALSALDANTKRTEGVAHSIRAAAAYSAAHLSPGAQHGYFHIVWTAAVCIPFDQRTQGDWRDVNQFLSTLPAGTDVLVMTRGVDGDGVASRGYL